MMPNRSKQKGDRAERALVELLRSFGLDAYRVPLSGAVNGFKDDIEIRLGNETLRLESKVRSKAFGNIYRWLENADCLVIKADRQEPLAVITMARLAKLIAADKPKSESHRTPSPKEFQPETILIDNSDKPSKIYLNYGPRTIGIPE